MKPTTYTATLNLLNKTSETLDVRMDINGLALRNSKISTNYSQTETAAEIVSRVATYALSVISSARSEFLLPGSYNVEVKTETLLSALSEVEKVEVFIQQGFEFLYQGGRCVSIQVSSAIKDLNFQIFSPESRTTGVDEPLGIHAAIAEANRRFDLLPDRKQLELRVVNELPKPSFDLRKLGDRFCAWELRMYLRSLLNSCYHCALDDAHVLAAYAKVWRLILCAGNVSLYTKAPSGVKCSDVEFLGNLFYYPA